MRKVFILALMFIAAMSYAQEPYKQITASEADSSKGAETDYQYIPNGTLSSQRALTIQVLCTQLGGTSDGTISLEGSIDGTSYAALDNSVLTEISDDSLTITNGAVWHAVIDRTTFCKYRLKIEGTSGDTTLLTTKYLLQKIE